MSEKNEKGDMRLVWKNIKLFKWIALLVLVLIFILLNMLINENRRRTFILCKDYLEHVCLQFTDFHEEDGQVTLSGFFFYYKDSEELIPSDRNNMAVGMVCIDNMNDKNEIESVDYINILETSDDKADAYFGLENLTTQKGVVGKDKSKKYNFENKNYVLAIKPDVNQKEAILTDYYIIDGQLVRDYDNEMVEPNMTGTDYENIVINGKLLYSNPSLDIWIYQYDWKLYYFAGEKYSFEDDGTTYIELMVNTTQVTKLPQSRLDMGCDFDNIGDCFEYYEVTANDINRYRISVRDIPTDYPVTVIGTGYYVDDKWVWHAQFRPVYEF